MSPSACGGDRELRSSGKLVKIKPSVKDTIANCVRFCRIREWSVGGRAQSRQVDVVSTSGALRLRYMAIFAAAVALAMLLLVCAHPEEGGGQRPVYTLSVRRHGGNGSVFACACV